MIAYHAVGMPERLVHGHEVRLSGKDSVICMRAG